jgi:hypothetical protein
MNYVIQAAPGPWPHGVETPPARNHGLEVFTINDEPANTYDFGVYHHDGVTWQFKAYSWFQRQVLVEYGIHMGEATAIAAALERANRPSNPHVWVWYYTLDYDPEVYFYKATFQKPTPEQLEQHTSKLAAKSSGYPNLKIQYLDTTEVDTFFEEFADV